jgi:hypothetical protein
VASDNINLVGLDLALELHRGDTGNQALAQRRGHDLDVIVVQIQFTCDLQIGKIETHEVKTQNPDAQRLMMTGQDGTTEIIETTATALAKVALTVKLGVIVTVPHNRAAIARRTANSVGPPVLTDQRKALVVIDKRGKIDQARGVHEVTRS